MRRDARLAFLWHSVALLFVGVLFVWELIGWVWSWQHRNPLVETKRPAR